MKHLVQKEEVLHIKQMSGMFHLFKLLTTKGLCWALQKATNSDQTGRERMKFNRLLHVMVSPAQHVQCITES